LLVGLVAIFAGQIAPFDPLEAHYTATRQSPFEAPYVLGTDDLGRDLLSRLIHGARVSLLVAFSSVVLGDFIGLVWGITSGYLGGRFDLISQRLLDVLMAFPGLILAMLLTVGLGAGLATVIIAIAITRVPPSTRIIRSVALSTKAMTYIEATRAIGSSPLRVMVFHVLPQCIAPFIVVVTVSIGIAILAEASLSFLGVGIPPPAPSWGNMLTGVVSGRFKPEWWLVVFPGATLTLTVLAANLFGDAVRDFFDPRLRGRIK
jgi:ABC-type dipeptide/oligopeptide/nickel transport system permease subunit